MKVQESLRILACSGIPTWIFDPELFRIHWANDKALELWHASSREELLSRDFSDISAATRTRLLGYVERFRRGLHAEEQWTLYPRGEPTTVKLFFSGIDLDDGRTVMFIQAFAADLVDEDLVRGIEALRHTSIFVALLDAEGAVLMRNPAAARGISPDLGFDRWFVDPGVAPEIRRRAGAGEVVQRDVAVRTTGGERWYALEARPVRDAVTGTPTILVHLADQTERLAAEQAVITNDHVIEVQRQQILALSAPILDVAPSTLAVPIIGTLDARRSGELSARLLAEVQARGAQRVILDLTGADAIDTDSVEQLMRLLRALRLLGARPIVTGLSPQLAMTLTGLGADLPGVLVLRSLQQALRS